MNQKMKEENRIKSDIEIAQSTPMLPISQVAEKAGIDENLLEYYGKVKAWFLNKYPNYQDVDFADIATSQKPEEKASTPSELRKTA